MCNCNTYDCPECGPGMYYAEKLKDTQFIDKQVIGKIDIIHNNMPAHLEIPHFIVKDSGQREQFSGGMVRDVETDKPDYTFIMDGPMFDRWAEHMTKGAKKYGDRNWMKAEGEKELARFRRSGMRHMRQWMRGDVDEDHASAVFFNINAYEWLKAKMESLK